MAGTLSNPSVGELNSTGDPKIVALVKLFNELLNGENKLPGSSLAAAAAIADTQLASPNNSAYRTILAVPQALSNDLEAGTYLMGNYSGTPVKSGASAGTIPGFYFDDADYAVAGKTLKMRLRAQIATNATKPTLKFTVGLYPVTVAGAADQIVFTLGAVVPGSTVEFNEPAASTITPKEAADFTVPADGAYVMGVVTSGALTNNNLSLLNAQLQVRNV